MPRTSPSTSSSTTSDTWAERRSAVLDTLQRMTLMLVLRFIPAEARKQLRAKWSAQTPQLAQAVADVIDSLPKLFATLPFTSETLRQTIVEVNEIATIRSFVDDMATKVSDHHLFMKADLHDKTQTAIAAVQSILQSPLTTPEVRDQLSRLARPLLDLIEARNQGIMATKLKNGQLREEGNEKVAEAEEKLAATERDLAVATGMPTMPLSSSLTAASPLANKRSSRSRRSRTRS